LIFVYFQWMLLAHEITLTTWTSMKHATTTIEISVVVISVVVIISSVVVSGIIVVVGLSVVVVIMSVMMMRMRMRTSVAVHGARALVARAADVELDARRGDARQTNLDERVLMRAAGVLCDTRRLGLAALAKVKVWTLQTLVAHADDGALTAVADHAAMHRLQRHCGAGRRRRRLD
jgi:hypothetical protein